MSRERSLLREPRARRCLKKMEVQLQGAASGFTASLRSRIELFFYGSRFTVAAVREGSWTEGFESPSKCKSLLARRCLSTDVFSVSVGMGLCFSERGSPKKAFSSWYRQAIGSRSRKVGPGQGQVG